MAETGNVSRSRGAIKARKAAKPTRKAATRRSLLSRLTGTVNNTASGLKKEIGRTSTRVLGVMGVRQAASAKKPPALPTAQQARTQEQRAFDQRRQSIAQAEPKTLDGKPFDVNADVTAFAKAGKNSWSAKKDELRELTWGRTPKQLEAINASYKDRFGTDLFQDLGKKLDKHEMASVNHLREGRRAEAAAAEMRDATDGWGVDKGRLSEIYGRLSPEDAKKATQLFNRDNPKGKSFDKLVDGSEAKELIAFSEGRRQDGSIAKMERTLQTGLFSGADGDHVINTFRSMSGDEAKQYVEEAKKKGLDVRGLVEKNLKGTEKTEALALMDGNRARADAARLQDSMDGWGSNKNKLWDTLEVDIKDPEERQAYTEARNKEFNSLYGPPDLEGRIKKEHSGEAQHKSLALARNGTLTEGERLRYSINGIDDPSVAINLTQQMGSENAQKAYAEATNGRNLATDANAKFGGRDQFEMKDALREPPKTRAELLGRLEEKARFEDADNNILSSLAGAFTNTDETMHNNNARARRELDLIEAAQKRGDTEEVEFRQARFDELTGYVKEDIKVFQGEKDGAVDVAAQVATTAAVVAATVATAGAAGPVLATAIVAGTGAVTNAGVRMGMQGGAYDHNELAKDLAVGAAEGLGAKAGNVVGGIARNTMLKGAATSGIRNIAVRGGAMAVDGAADGLVGGALSGATEVAMDKRTWNNGFGSGLLQMGESAAFGAAMGAATGAVVGPAMEMGMKGISRAVGRGGDAVPSQVELDGGSRFAASRAPDVDMGSNAGGTRRMASLSRDSYQASSSYTNLAPEARADFDRLLGSAGKSDKLDDALLRLLEDGKLGKTDMDGKTLLDNLVALKENPRHVNFRHLSDDIYESTVRHVDDIGSIHQGDNGTCAATSAQINQANHRPADYVRTINELSTERKARLMKDGEFMEVNDRSTTLFDGETGEPIADPRDIVSRIYQPTLMDQASKIHQVNGVRYEYDPNMRTETVKRIDANGKEVEITRELEGWAAKYSNERGGFRAYDAKTGERVDKLVDGYREVSDGLTPQEQKFLFEKLLDQKGYRTRNHGLLDVEQAYLDSLKPGQKVDINHPDIAKLHDYLKYLSMEAESGNAAVQMGLKWGGGGHAVVLAGQTPDGNLIIKNPQMNSRDMVRSGPPRTVDVAVLGAERAEQGYSIMTPEDLIAVYKSVVYTELK